MGEDSSDAMNLDLNLGPYLEPPTRSITIEASNLDDWIEEPLQQICEVAARLRGRQRWRWRQLLISPPYPQQVHHILPQSYAQVH
ncbi:unnamed protein product [Lathyrus oleraceus]